MSPLTFHFGRRFCFVVLLRKRSFVFDFGIFIISKILHFKDSSLVFLCLIFAKSCLVLPCFVIVIQSASSVTGSVNVTCSKSRWFRTAKNRVVSTGPLTRPFARWLTPLTHLLTPLCSLCSCAWCKSAFFGPAHQLHFSSPFLFFPAFSYKFSTYNYSTPSFECPPSLPPSLTLLSPSLLSTYLTPTFPCFQLHLPLAIKTYLLSPPPSSPPHFTLHLGVTLWTKTEKKPSKNSYLIIHFPTSSGVSGRSGA